MVSLKNKNKGFTIVELLIVIVVIGILATLVIVTFTGIQQKAHDSQRQTDINAVDSHLEAYYAESGNYPTLAQVTDSTWVSTHMKGLDPDALLAPGSTTAIDSSTATKSKYSYAPTEGGTTACTATGTADDSACDTFKVSAMLESDGSIYMKKSN